MYDHVVIRGIGLVTPLGVGAAATWARLLAGTFIATHARCPVVPPSPPPDAGEARPGRRVHGLAEAAARECIASVPGWTPARSADARTALVVATSRGPADDWADAASGGGSSPAGVAGGGAAGRVDVSFGLAGVADHLARALGHGLGPRLTLSAACAGGLHALIRAALLIEHGDADRAVVVAAESSLHPMFVESFRRLGVLAPPGERCRPFDVDRCGFLCAEAAAAVVLERAGDPAAGGTAGVHGAAGVGGSASAGTAAGDVRLDRYAFAGDASHLTGSDPSGATLRRLLAAAVDGRPVDVIHAHGTGTEANDAAEAAAIDAVLGTAVATTAAAPPAVYSHKGAVGHSVGAAGLVSVVLNVLMHRHGVVPPNVGVRTPLALRRAVVHPGSVARPVRRSVALAAGFGGATAAVSLTSSTAP